MIEKFVNKKIYINTFLNNLYLTSWMDYRHGDLIEFSDNYESRIADWFQLVNIFYYLKETRQAQKNRNSIVNKFLSFVITIMPNCCVF